MLRSLFVWVFGRTSVMVRYGKYVRRRVAALVRCCIEAGIFFDGVDGPSVRDFDLLDHEPQLPGPATVSGTLLSDSLGGVRKGGRSTGRDVRRWRPSEPRKGGSSAPSTPWPRAVSAVARTYRSALRCLHVEGVLSGPRHPRRTRQSRGGFGDACRSDRCRNAGSRDVGCQGSAHDHAQRLGTSIRTLAASLVAAKAGIFQAHVEAASTSSGDPVTMPAEVNRVGVTDRLSDLLFTHSDEADENLSREGVAPARIRLVGNVMIDSLMRLRPRWQGAGTIALGEVPARYGVVTLHRPSNVDEPERLSCILEALSEVATYVPLIFPVHPRTRARLARTSVRGVRLVRAAGISRFPRPRRARLGRAHGFRWNSGGDKCARSAVHHSA